MNRAGQESERDTTLEDDSGQEGEVSSKEIDKKMSPLSTLESSFESLNVKKFDAAFSVCCYCKHVVKSAVEEMVWNIRMKNEISPTLQSIVNQFDEDNRRLSSFDFSDQKSGEQFDAVCPDGIRFDGDGYGNCTAWDNDDDEQISVVDVGPIGADSSFPCYPQENDPVSFHDPYMDDSFENVDEYLFLSLGFTSKQNAWAGPDHWKYQKAKVSEVIATENGSPTTAKRPRNKKQAEIDIDFTKALEKTMLDIFCPPKNPKTLLLPENRPHCNTKLPEDCHYQPEDLVKLFLLPNVKCLGKKRGVFSDETREQCNEYGSFPSWDDGSVCGGDYGDGDIHDAEEDSSTLVSQPRQVNKIDVQYDKTSKQVDVQALKITLWDRIQESHQSSAQGQGEMTSFSQILANFPSDCSAAPTINDISPHLCFICLLHLANEHGLSIHNCTNLDDLSIYLPHIGTDISGTI
ncbi:Condensin complex subunit 2 [Quillaja saponaria]|uniref:Condensin complex subunit 2 n=1 Tax=Quillaja saponaria TaxID=32244 RepID=A0AAD7QGY8_QUISA|nr:Condensin complex subunit 2 [Quillaja saponaria]